ncbi:hypothetical protein Tco_1179398 [Tanacetum coccineum]
MSIDDLYNNLSVFEQDIQKTSSSSLASDNVAFLSQAKASSSKHKPSHSSGSYGSYTTSSSKTTTTATPGLADEVIHSFLATNADDVDLIHEDLDQIDDLDLEEMDIIWQSGIACTKEDGSLEISATIDTLRYTISEASIRNSLQLDDATGITMLPNDDLFEGMGQIGYPTDGTFTFWKSFFTPQWRYLVHHLLHCISSKSGGWDQFGSNIATALICLSTGRVYNFSKLIFDVSPFSANDFEYSNRKQTPLSSCEPDQKDIWEYEKGFSRGTKTFIAFYVICYY